MSEQSCSGKAYRIEISRRAGVSEWSVTKAREMCLRKFKG